MHLHVDTCACTCMKPNSLNHILTLQKKNTKRLTDQYKNKTIAVINAGDYIHYCYSILHTICTS